MDMPTQGSIVDDFNQVDPYFGLQGIDHVPLMKASEIDELLGSLFESMDDQADDSCVTTTVEDASAALSPTNEAVTLELLHQLPDEPMPSLYEQTESVKKQTTYDPLSQQQSTYYPPGNTIEFSDDCLRIVTVIPFSSLGMQSAIIDDQQLQQLLPVSGNC